MGRTSPKASRNSVSSGYLFRSASDKGKVNVSAALPEREHHPKLIDLTVRKTEHDNVLAPDRGRRKSRGRPCSGWPCPRDGRSASSPIDRRARWWTRWSSSCASAAERRLGAVQLSEGELLLAVATQEGD